MFEEFRRKGKVELRFPEQFYIKGMSWHKINPCGKITGSKQHFKTAESESHIGHILNYKGPIPLKSSFKGKIK